MALLVGVATLCLPLRVVHACEVPVSTAPGAQFEPRMIPDGAGGSFVVWRDTRDSSTNGDDLYLQHLLPGPVVDPDWPTNGIAIVATT